MAYNSLKRIFGETKLELKLLFLFGVGPVGDHRHGVLVVWLEHRQARL